MTDATPKRAAIICDYNGCTNPGTVLWHNGMDIYCSQHAEQFRMTGQWLEKARRLRRKQS